MKLKSLQLQHYKGFSESKIDFDGRTTIFFGPNGVGKSSVLEAIGSVFAPLLSGIINKGSDKKVKKPKDNLDMDDIKFGESAAKLSAKILVGEEQFTYSRMINKKKKEDTREEKLAIIERFCSRYLWDQKYDNEENSMPIYANYGTHRAVRVVKVQRVHNQHESFEKIFALENAIENTVDFRTFFEWFRTEQEIENNKKVETGDMTYQDKALSCVKKAVLSMLGEQFTDLKIMFHPLRMVAAKNGENLKIEQLSDGEKCTLAMVGDLARRLAIANYNMNNPLLGKGIVLIDEIELHLHPSWQGRIVPVLMEIFPNIQFLITTHSPKVLSELKRDVNIYSISMEKNCAHVKLEKNMALFDINTIFAKYMDTSFATKEASEFSDRVYRSIEKRDFDLAQQLIDEWIERTDNLNPEVIKAQLALKRGWLLDAKNRKE